jgi:cellobiose phosphorylase
MLSVNERLATEHGLLLCDPPHVHPDEHIQLPLLVYPPGHKENGGIFCHSNAWAIVAECLLGHGDRAHEYYRSFLPARYNDLADLRQVEPYVYCQFTHGKTSPRFGQSRNPWLTGTASWTYIAVTQHMLGLKPTLNGLRIDPCIPRSWKGFEVERMFRGRRLSIRVDNPGGLSRGVRRLRIDGIWVEGNVVDVSRLDREAMEIVAYLEDKDD